MHLMPKEWRAVHWHPEGFHSTQTGISPLELLEIDSLVLPCPKECKFPVSAQSSPPFPAAQCHTGHAHTQHITPAAPGHPRNHRHGSKAKPRDVGQPVCQQSSCSRKDLACLPLRKQTPPSILNCAGCPVGPGMLMPLQTNPWSKEGAIPNICCPFDPLSPHTPISPERLEIKL